MKRHLTVLTVACASLLTACATPSSPSLPSKVILDENATAMTMADALARCPNLRDAANHMKYPKAAIADGLTSGDIVVHMDLLPSGELTHFRTTGATSEVFAAPALEGARNLRCTPGAEAQPIRWAIHFVAQ